MNHSQLEVGCLSIGCFTIGSYNVLMVYIEDIKMYAVAIIIVLVVMFFGIFFYKWYTQPIPGAYCGEYNNYYCQVGKCSYITSYESGKVGYCRAKLLGF